MIPASLSMNATLLASTSPFVATVQSVLTRHGAISPADPDPVRSATQLFRSYEIGLRQWAPTAREHGHALWSFHQTLREALPSDASIPSALREIVQHPSFTGLFMPLDLIGRYCRTLAAQLSPEATDSREVLSTNELRQQHRLLTEQNEASLTRAQAWLELGKAAITGQDYIFARHLLQCAYQDALSFKTESTELLVAIYMQFSQHPALARPDDFMSTLQRDIRSRQGHLALIRQLGPEYERLQRTQAPLIYQLENLRDDLDLLRETTLQNNPEVIPASEEITALLASITTIEQAILALEAQRQSTRHTMIRIILLIPDQSTRHRELRRAPTHYRLAQSYIQSERRGPSPFRALAWVHSVAHAMHEGEPELALHFLRSAYLDVERTLHERYLETFKPYERSRLSPEDLRPHGLDPTRISRLDMTSSGNSLTGQVIGNILQAFLRYPELRPANTVMNKLAHAMHALGRDVDVQRAYVIALNGLHTDIIAQQEHLQSVREKNRRHHKIASSRRSSIERRVAALAKTDELNEEIHRLEANIASQREALQMVFQMALTQSRQIEAVEQRYQQTLELMALTTTWQDISLQEAIFPELLQSAINLPTTKLKKRASEAILKQMKAAEFGTASREQLAHFIEFATSLPTDESSQQTLLTDMPGILTAIGIRNKDESYFIWASQLISSFSNARSRAVAYHQMGVLFAQHKMGQPSELCYQLSANAAANILSQGIRFILAKGLEFAPRAPSTELFGWRLHQSAAHAIRSNAP